MGMHVGAGSGGTSRRGRRKKHAPVAEINVTPFVDVMLVLLIIFMVAAPMLATGVPIELPETVAKPLPSSKDKPLTISVTTDGQVFLGDQEKAIPIEEFGPKLVAIKGALNKDDVQVWFRGDREIPGYETFMKVMATISESGFKKISFVTVPEGTNTKKSDKE